MINRKLKNHIYFNYFNFTEYSLYNNYKLHVNNIQLTIFYRMFVTLHLYSVL